MKRAAKSFLAKRGIAVLRSLPYDVVEPELCTPEELTDLHRTVDAMPWESTAKGFAVWDSATALKGYLKRSRVHAYHEIVKVAREAGVEFAGRRVLDVGTCSGYLLRVVEQQAPDVSLFGCDYYQGCVDIASQLVPHANVFQAGIADLDSATKYDVIFCTEVLEHIIDTETPIPTMLGLLNPGGALVVSVPNALYDHTPPLNTTDGNSYEGHVNAWSPYSWSYYLDRILPDTRKVTGSLSMNIAGDGLYAVIFKD